MSSLTHLPVWGKLGGASLGLMIGGPLGALIGALIGHVAMDREGAPLGPSPPDVVFATGLIALSAKMARVDGVVTHDEVRAFERVVVVPEEDDGKVRALFNLAKATPDGFEAYAGQLASAFADRPDLLEDVLDGLFHIAKADHAIHEAELAYLRTVASIFAFEDAAYDRIEARHVRLANDPYAVLGVQRDMPLDEIRRVWRKLAAQNHPDRHIAAGLPPEAIGIATSRIAAINAAWDRIERERAEP